MAAFKIEYNDGSYWVFADILPNTPWAEFLTREVAERFIEHFVADLEALKRIYAKLEAWVNPGGRARREPAGSGRAARGDMMVSREKAEKERNANRQGFNIYG